MAVSALPLERILNVKVIGECHKAVHDMGTPRIAVSRATIHNSDSQTDIRIGTRVDRSISSGGNDGKVKRVEEILVKAK